MVGDDRYYKILLEDGSYVVDPETRQPKLFKYLMLSTNAEVMTELLSGIDDTELQELKDALKTAEYYRSTLQFHYDQRFVSPGGTKVYIPYDPTHDTATLNRSRPDLYPQGAPLVVNSWMMEGQTLVPDPNLIFEDATMHYVHPKIDNNFRHAQHVIEKFQGKYGIFFGGILAGFNDSHESAMQANLRAAWMISKAAGFTEEQCYKLKHSAMPKFKPKFSAAQLGVDSEIGINMQILSGFIAAIGIAAVAIAFTVLNAAMFATAGIVVASIGVTATLLGGIGLFKYASGTDDNYQRPVATRAANDLISSI